MQGPTRNPSLITLKISYVPIYILCTNFVSDKMVSNVCLVNEYSSQASPFVWFSSKDRLETVSTPYNQAVQVCATKIPKRKRLMSASPPEDEPIPRRRRGRPRKDEVRPPRPPSAVDLSGPRYEFINVSDTDPTPAEEERKRIRKQAMLHHLRRKRYGPGMEGLQGSAGQSIQTSREQSIDRTTLRQTTTSPFNSPELFPEADEAFRNSASFQELKTNCTQTSNYEAKSEEADFFALVIDYFRHIRNMEPEVLATFLSNPARVYHLTSGFDAMNDRGPTSLGMTLKSQLIKHLNDNLSDPAIALSVENLAAVHSIRIGTMLYELGTGEEVRSPQSKSAEAHTQGLSKMMSLSGGFDALSETLPGCILQKVLILTDCNTAATTARQLSFPHTNTIAQLLETESRPPTTPTTLVAECPFYCPPSEIPFARIRQSPLCNTQTLDLLLALYNFFSSASSSSSPSNPQLRSAHRARIEALTTSSPPPKTPTSIQSRIYLCVYLCTLIILHISPHPSRPRHPLASLPRSYAHQLKRTLQSTTALVPLWYPLTLLHWWVNTIGQLASLGREEYPYFLAATVQANHQVMVDEALLVGAYRGSEWWVGALASWREEEGGGIEEGAFVEPA
ncbi:MAG: hypothetical protein Q9160_001650 [Pyrenula sp. 1 TL-2023]